MSWHHLKVQQQQQQEQEQEQRQQQQQEQEQQEQEQEQEQQQQQQQQQHQQEFVQRQSCLLSGVCKQILFFKEVAILQPELSEQDCSRLSGRQNWCK